LTADTLRALRADEELANLLAPQLRDHPSRFGEAAQCPDALEQLLEPALCGRHVIVRDVGESLVDLPVGE